MKKILLVGLLVLSVFLISCGEETLPPEPAPPGAIPTEGSGAIAGQAVAYAGYADPEGYIFLPASLFEFFDRDAVDYLTAIVRGDQFIYKTGYITNQNLAWVPFEYTGERVGDSNWLRESAMGAGLHISLESNVEGENYIVAYGCTRRLGTWDCHGNQWILQTFNVSFSGCGDACPPGYACVEDECVAMPEEPTVPGQLGGCVDSDGGKDYNVRGTTEGSLQTGGRITVYDGCMNVSVGLEKFCEGGQLKSENFYCPNSSCTSGRCSQGGGLSLACTDSDGGKVYAVSGTVEGQELRGSRLSDRFTRADYCHGPRVGTEFFCGVGSYGAEDFICPNNDCVNGACQLAVGTLTGVTNQTTVTNQTASTNQTSAINQTGATNQTSVNATNTTASCTNECSSSGLQICSYGYAYAGYSGAHLKICGNFDADACLEWGYYRECPYGCINSACQPAPSNQTDTTNQTGTANQTGTTNQTNQSG